MTSAFSWQTSGSLCPGSFHIPRSNMSVIPDVSGLPTFAVQSPVMKRTSFFGVIHVAANNVVSFFVMAEQYYVVYMYHV